MPLAAPSTSPYEPQRLAVLAALVAAACAPAAGARDAASGPDDARADVPPQEACDPIRGTGCAAPLRCAAADRYPIVGHCMVAGAAPLGAPCAASASCGAGLHCILRRCLRACANDEDCASSGGPSRCAVPAAGVGWLACTIVGECDDADGASCGAGLVCRPSDPTGGGRCTAPGAGAEGAPCEDSNACDRSTTCVIPAAGFVGTCRPVCPPAGAACASPRRCTALQDRPLDYRACSP